MAYPHGVLLVIGKWAILSEKSPAPARKGSVQVFLFRTTILAMSNRVCVFVDGGNFYHLALKQIGITESNFDFDKFVEFIAGDRDVGYMCKRYYIGTVFEVMGDVRSKEAMSRQVALFNRLKSSGWKIQNSKLRSRTDIIPIDNRVEGYADILSKGIAEIKYTRLREKGIDVKLATDLIVGAVDDQYDTAIVVSSDNDLVPAIDWVRYKRSKKVEYVGFSMPHEDPEESIRPSLTLTGRTDIQRTLVESDLSPFIKT